MCVLVPPPCMSWPPLQATRAGLHRHSSNLGESHGDEKQAALQHHAAAARTWARIPFKCRAWVLRSVAHNTLIIPFPPPPSTTHPYHHPFKYRFSALRSSAENRYFWRGAYTKKFGVTTPSSTGATQAKGGSTPRAAPRAVSGAMRMRNGRG